LEKPQGFGGYGSGRKAQAPEAGKGSGSGELLHKKRTHFKHFGAKIHL